jgi:hypothetical protein
VPSLLKIRGRNIDDTEVGTHWLVGQHATETAVAVLAGPYRQEDKSGSAPLIPGSGPLMDDTRARLI